MVAAERQGGIVFRVDGDLQFLPASASLQVVAVPRVTAVAGAPPELLGIAMHEGEIVPVIAIGSENRADDERACATMIVCAYANELLGLVGADVVATGFFDPAPACPGGVVLEGGTAPSLDLAAIYARVQAARAHLIT